MANDAGAVELGVKRQADTNGFITGLRFYKCHAEHRHACRQSVDVGGTLLGSVPFAGDRFGLAAGDVRESYRGDGEHDVCRVDHTNTGFYAATNGLTAAVDNTPAYWQAARRAATVSTSARPTAFPNQTFAASSYWRRDVHESLPPDTTPPTVTSTTPAANATNVSPLTTVTATFSEAVSPAPSPPARSR
jgi:hypothetical protein